MQSIKIDVNLKTLRIGSLKRDAKMGATRASHGRGREGARHASHGEGREAEARADREHAVRAQ